jgi:cell division protease FtsH
MTETLGAVRIGTGDQDPFLGRDYGHQRDYSEDIAAKVDEEVAKFLANAHQEAFDCLTENRDVLDALVRELFENETLDKEQVAKVFEPLRRRPKRPAWTGSETRVPSDLPPVDPPPMKERQPLSASVPPASLPPGQANPGQLPPAPYPPPGAQPPPFGYPPPTPEGQPPYQPPAAADPSTPEEQPGGESDKPQG